MPPTGPSSSKQLTGYNHNFRHNDAIFHIQTEDAGPARAYVVTHLFAAGGWIIGTVKTSYRHLLQRPDWPSALRALMKSQHKAMAIGLRDGEFDELIAAGREDATPSQPEDESEASEVPEPRPSAPDRTRFEGLTRMLDRLEGGVGVAVVDVESALAVSLRDGAIPEGVGERVAALAPRLADDETTPWTQLVVLRDDIAYAVLRRHNFVMFMDTVLDTAFSGRRFRVQVRQVAEFLGRE